jgi:D-alanyl-D-alanine carboxypeptidase
MKQQRTAFCTLVVVFVAWGAAWPGDPLQKRLDGLRAAAGFPGCNLAAVYADGRMACFSSGAVDTANSRPMRAADRMFTGSVGKTFVAAAALKLVEQGLLGLEEPIQKHLGNRPWFARLPAAKEIRVRMLLNHSSGIAEHVEDERFARSLILNPDRVWTPDELVSFVLDREPLFAPGKGFSYADTNYILLGMIVERVAQKSLYQLVDDWFIKPLALTATEPAICRRLPGLIQGSTGPEPFGFPREVVQNGLYVVNPQFEWAGGGFITTAADLARWGHHLYHGDLLRPETKALMLQAIAMDAGHGASASYGLGVMVWSTPHGPAYGHGGIFPGYQSVVKYYPELGLTLAMQFNQDRTANPEMKKVYDFPDLFVRELIEKRAAKGPHPR